MTKDPNQIRVRLKPFKFPNFLSVRTSIGFDIKIPVSDLSIEDAAGYWDAMKDHWINHVFEKRRTSRD